MRSRGSGNIILLLLYHARNHASEVLTCNCAHYSAEHLINNILILLLLYWGVHIMSGKKGEKGKPKSENDY